VAVTGGPAAHVHTYQQPHAGAQQQKQQKQEAALAPDVVASSRNWAVCKPGCQQA
jgi:hypothetical protein